VTAVAGAQDNRFTEVSLTPSGEELLRKLMPVVGRQFTRAMQGISDRDIQQLVRTLKTIRGNLSKLAIE
jgi:MarR family transcriptional regulator, organic hydroperoxide resistance regulator